MLANNHPAAGGPVRRERRRAPTGSPKAVELRWPPSSAPLPRLILDDVVDPDNAHHHDPARLAAAIIRAYERRGRHPAPRPSRSGAREPDAP